VIYELGPRARRIYAELRASILNGERAAGDKLAAHTQLATHYGVAPMTMRHVLAQLEVEGLVVRDHGRGTFVCEPNRHAVLIVDDDRLSRLLLSEQVRQLGHRPVEASGPAEGLALLQADPRLALVLSDVRMPTAADGITFMRTVRRRWPELALAAVTGYAEDLAGLVFTPDRPLLILSKPVRTEDLQQVLRLTLSNVTSLPRAAAAA
jgi:CheY-like chemotaxis protein